MKIAFILDQFPVISETFIMHQIIKLIDKEEEIDIITLRASKETIVHKEIGAYGLNKRVICLNLDSTGLRIVTLVKHLLRALALRPIRSIQYLSKLYIYSKNNKITFPCVLSLLYRLAPFLATPYDLIHAHFGNIANEFVHVPELTGIKLITSFLGHDVTLFPEGRPGIYNKLFRISTTMLCTSRYLYEKLLLLGCPEERLSIHRIGINLDDYPSIIRRPPLNGEIRLISVSRLVEKKGIIFAIEAVKMLQGRYPLLQYTIIGDGKLKKKLEDKIESLKLGGSVRLLGAKNRKEVISNLLSHHIFLFPSIKEELGFALVEAMTTCMPAVTTSVGGIPEVMEDGKSGIMVRPSDSVALSEGITKLIEQPEKWAKMGLRGREHIINNYDIDYWIKILRDYYRYRKANSE